MTNTYISPIEYRRAPTGQETNSLLGNLLRLSALVAAGGTALTTPATTVNLAQYDNIYIFDGASSEIVTVTATTNAGATSIPITATQFAHVSGTVICSDGAQGSSLGEAIFIASANLESITQQALFQTIYIETLGLRSLEAVITNDYQLAVRPRHFPVTAISALSLETQVSSVLALDPTQAIIETRGRLIKVPTISTLGPNGVPIVNRPPLDPTQPGFVNLTYTAGFPYASMPWDYKQAAVLLTSVQLSDRLNTTGAAEYQSGKVKTTVFLRGDTSGESALYKRAVKLLEPVTRER